MRVADVGGNRVDRVRLDAVGQQLAVAVHDVGPLGGRLDGAHAAAVRPGGRSRRAGAPAGTRSRAKIADRPQRQDDRAHVEPLGNDGAPRVRWTAGSRCGSLAPGDDGRRAARPPAGRARRRWRRPAPARPCRAASWPSARSAPARSAFRSRGADGGSPLPRPPVPAASARSDTRGAAARTAATPRTAAPRPAARRCRASGTCPGGARDRPRARWGCSRTSFRTAYSNDSVVIDDLLAANSCRFRSTQLRAACARVARHFGFGWHQPAAWSARGRAAAARPAARETCA